jgi:biotin carboxylase
MKTVLRAAGVPCAQHRLADSPAAAVDFVEQVGFPVVVKPPAGAGAKSTFRLDDAEDLRVWLDGAPPTADAPALLEEFLTGEEGSFDSVTVQGELVWHSVSHYLPTPLEVLRNPWIQWAVLMPRSIDGPEYERLRTTAAAGLRALGLVTGLTHMEWFRRPDGSIAVSEVAVRPPGGGITSMLNFAHDMDLYSDWARLMIYGDFEPKERRWAVGTAYLRGQGSGRVRAVHGIDSLPGQVQNMIMESRLPQPGQISSSSYEGDGTVIVRHPDTPVVMEALRRLVTDVRVELEPT